MQKNVHFLLVPKMIAAGDDVHARIEEFVGGIDGDAGAAGGVFAVGDDEVEAKALSQLWKKLPERVPPGFANNITDKKQIHTAESIRQRPASKPWAHFTFLGSCS